jgi:hypothetical protein
VWDRQQWAGTGASARLCAGIAMAVLAGCGGQVEGNGVTASSASQSTSVNITFIDTTTPVQSVQTTWIIGPPDTTTTSPVTTSYVCGTFGCASGSYAVCSTGSAYPCPNIPGACQCFPNADAGADASDSGLAGGDAAAVPDGGLDGSALDAVATDSGSGDALVDVDEQ